MKVQIDKLLINFFKSEFVDKKPGKINANTATKKITDII